MAGKSKITNTAGILSLMLAAACLTKALLDVVSSTPYAGVYAAFGLLFLLDAGRRLYRKE